MDLGKLRVSSCTSVEQSCRVWLLVLHFGQVDYWCCILDRWKGLWLRMVGGSSLLLPPSFIAALCLSTSDLSPAIFTDERHLSRPFASCCHDRWLNIIITCARCFRASVGLCNACALHVIELLWVQAGLFIFVLKADSRCFGSDWLSKIAIWESKHD